MRQKNHRSEKPGYEPEAIIKLCRSDPIPNEDFDEAFSIANSILTMRLVSVLSLCFLLATSCERSSIHNDLTALQLASFLSKVEPWPDGSTNYSSANWEYLTLAAIAVQRSDPDAAEKAIRDYQNTFKAGHIIREDSKLYLLLRVVFDLPESALNRDAPPQFGAWINFSTMSATNQTINVAWPISWKGGSPHLISGYSGLQGERYDARDEFRCFRTNYHQRQIQTVKY